MIFSVISSVLIIIAIVCLFGLTPERVTDDLMRIITPNDTMRDKSRNLRGNKKKHRLYRNLVKMKTALAVTGKSKQFTIVFCASLVLFAAGIIAAVLIDNLFLMPVLSAAFALIPFFYTTSTLSYYEKHTKEELETALSIITTSYVRSDDIVAAVRENIKYIKPPLRDVFKSFEGEATAISSNIKHALYKLKSMVDNEIFWEWCDTLIQCQDDRTLKDTLLPVVAKLTDVRIVNSELKTMLAVAVNTVKMVERNVIEYAADEMKTEKRMYVSGIGCNEYNAVERFKTTLNTCGDKGKRVCYHGYQSFKEDEVDAETAHEIGKALAENLWGDKFQVLVATHCNTGHYHNHFIICATSYKDGTKFHNGKDDYRRMREESDRLCKEYGLSVIRNPKAKGKSYAEWRAEFEGRPTVRGTIREAIDIAISGSGSKREFLDAMDQMGFIIDQSGKYPKIKHVGGERFVRFNSLGPGYFPEEIVDRIMSNDYPEFPEVPPQESPQQIFEGQNKPVASMNYTAVYHCFVTALKITTERPQTNKKMCFLVHEDQGKMRSYSDQLMMLTEHKIENREQLLAYREKALSQISEVIKLRQDMRNALKRAIRAGDETMISKTKYNIDIYTRQLKKLRREINACDGVLERMDSVREKLTRIESEKFRGKDNCDRIKDRAYEN